MEVARYDEGDIRSLGWREHIRLRPGMYIGKLGDGEHADDGIYILLKEIIDNSVDEFVMGAGKRIDVSIDGQTIRVRDYGRGIPLGALTDCVGKINTGGKYGSKAFKKSVGLNGVGTKAVNALCSRFVVQSFREGKTARVLYKQGELVQSDRVAASKEPQGTLVEFTPDPSIF